MSDFFGQIAEYMEMDYWTKGGIVGKLCFLGAWCYPILILLAMVMMMVAVMK